MNDSIKNGYKFAVYRHPIVIGADLDRLIYRQFVVLKDPDGIIIAFTNFYKYIHSSLKYGSKHVSDDGNNRFYFVVAFLNFIFFDKQNKYHIPRLTEITKPILQDFFTAYGASPSIKTQRTKSTVDKCVNSIVDFLTAVIHANPGKCIMHESDFTIKEVYRTMRGVMHTRNKLIFEVYYSKHKKAIFRDMPNSVFNIFISYAATYYTDIFFLIIMSSFAGLRPAESCNVSLRNLFIRKTNGILTKATIDLLEERPLRSDLVDVGAIKKARVQEVYRKFLPAFEYCYNIHMKYMQSQKVEKDFLPMSTNSRGMAYTYDNYYSRFRKMVKEIIPALLESNNPEVVEYALSLQENNISPHIFRHWFSVRLTLYGEDVAGLQYWRGDSSPESAMIYLQNKGELEKQLRQVSNGIFDFTQFQTNLQRRESE